MSDLIKREDVIKAIEELPNAYNGWSDAYDKAYIIGTLEEVPKADKPQGKWIFDPEILCSDIGVYSAGYRCSVCGKDYFKVEGMNFCPNCGAKMKGADDE